MTPKQIELVRASWRRLAPRHDQTLTMFYEQLLTSAPSLTLLFTGDLTLQRHKLVVALNTVIEDLHRLDALAPQIREMGRRHQSYGVKAHHYATVGTALLGTLEEVAGPDFTPEVRMAWMETYELLAKTMQQTAEAEAPAVE